MCVVGDKLREVEALRILFDLLFSQAAREVAIGHRACRPVIVIGTHEEMRIEKREA